MFPPTAFPEAKISANPDPDPIEAILQNRTDADVIDTVDVPRSLHKGKVLGINLGKNKLSAADSVDDFVTGVKTLGPYADVLIVNVSSPNTPGLRSLQRREIVEDLLKQVVSARDALQVQKKPVVLLKIAPDLSRQEVGDIGEAAKSSKIDGIIVSNTTISRPSSAGNDPALREVGGLSGPPVKPLALRTLKTLYGLTEGQIPLVGCGGISTGEDAIEYAKAGASFVQLYTALGYQGVGLPRMLKDEIAAYLRAEQKTWQDLIGTGIDLAGIKAVGRESSPTRVLSLEEEASDSFETLKQEIENALAGKLPSPKPLPLTRDEKLASFLPDWSDNLSPAFSAQATAPVADVRPSSAAESGMVPDGTPQVVIVDRLPEYTPAQPLSDAELRSRLDNAKQYIKESKQHTEKDLKEGGNVVAEAFKQAGRELQGDVQTIGSVSKDAARQASHTFGQLGHEIKEELHVVEDVAKDGARLAGQTFQAFGRDLKQESQQAAHEAAKIGKTMKDEADYVAREISKDLRHDKGLVKDWAHRAYEVGQAATAQSKEVAEQFGRDLRRETHDAAQVGKEALERSGETFRRFGEDVRAESRDAAREGEALLRDEARNLRQDARQAAAALAEGGKLDAEATRAAGRDMKEESATLAEIAKDALHRAGEGFREIGREIKHDPLLRKAQEQVTRASQTDPRGGQLTQATDGVRSDAFNERKGLSSLFSTFGERRNVTENSKRLV